MNKKDVYFILDFWGRIVRSRGLKARILGRRAIPVIEKLLQKHTPNELVSLLSSLPLGYEIELYHLLSDKYFSLLKNAEFSKPLTPYEKILGVVRGYLVRMSRKKPWLSEVLILLPWEYNPDAQLFLLGDRVVQYALYTQLITEEWKSRLNSVLKSHNPNRRMISEYRRHHDMALKETGLFGTYSENLMVLKQFILLEVFPNCEGAPSIIRKEVCSESE